MHSRGRGDGRPVTRAEASHGKDGVAGPVREPAAGLFDDEPRGCDVPDPALFLDVAIESPDGDVGQLGHGAAEGPDAAAARLQSGQELEVLLAAMPLAPDHRPVVESPRRYLQSPAVAHGTRAVHGDVERVLGRTVQASQHRLALPQQRDRDREVWQAAREVARAVDRVDDPQPVATETTRFRLLAEEAGLRPDPAQRSPQFRFGAKVDPGHEVAGCLAPQVGRLQLVLGARDA